ncbi:ATP-binding protein [Corynebacterium striatum]|uniref:ATP-binding protein n=1 Tax=Corynebacterium striatum TaxID=43770 RepID=UPI000C290555|nr:ATP-binding protein [Corynebacterium striatum]ATZ05194.1 hypothetical protein BBR43_02345 [Corynebacterium striatum]HCD3015101.1 ATP-binding protein [Corynebacterium striatum]
MDRIPNPFTAALGVSPAVLAGREEELDLITMAMLDGPGAHERVSVVSGARGSGKTVFLNAVEDRASQLGWTIISETATQGVVERIRNTAERHLQEFSPADKRRLSGISIAGIGSINWETDPISPTQSSLRTALTALLDAKAQLDSITGQPPSGVLITLDELHYTNRDEIIEFATTIQHLLRENREITVIMAGIPSAVKPLLSSPDGSNPITFLRRANRIDLGAIPDPDVSSVLTDTAKIANFSWHESALRTATEESGGYPFYFQLIGLWSFFEAQKSGRTNITGQDVAVGIKRATNKLHQLVHEPAIADITPGERDFLIALAQCDLPARNIDVLSIMGTSPQNISNYRQKLLSLDLVIETADRKMTFQLPRLEDYLLSIQGK